MAGDWIAMRVDLREDPATIAIGLALGMNTFEVVGRLHAVWRWADQQSVDGRFPGLEIGVLDGIALCVGFGEAMVAVGWIVVGRNGFSFPNFDRWNTDPGKSRLLRARRNQRFRDAKRDAKRDASETLAASLDVLSSSDVFSSPDGEEGENGATMPMHPAEAQELAMDGDLARLLKVVQPWLLCGPAKARDCLSRWRRPVGATWEAWQAYARSVGLEKARIAALTQEHPDVMPEDIPPPTIQQRQQQATVKKAMELLRQQEERS